MQPSSKGRDDSGDNMNVNLGENGIEFTILDKNADLNGKGAIRIALLMPDGSRHLHDLYPLALPAPAEKFYAEVGGAAAFGEKLRAFKLPELPETRNIIFANDECFIIAASSGAIPASRAFPMPSADAATLLTRVCGCVATAHRAGFSWDGFEPQDVRITPNGPVLPPPARPKTAQSEAADVASLGRLLCAAVLGEGAEPKAVFRLLGGKGTNAASAEPVMFDASAPSAEDAAEPEPWAESARSLPNSVRELLLAASSPAPESLTSAEQFGRAIKIAARLEKRSKNRVMLKVITTAGLLTLLAAAAVMVILGYGKLQTEKTEAYLAEVAAAAEDINSGDFTSAAIKLDAAIASDPQRVTAYYYRALAYYKDGDFEGCRQYIESEVASRDLAIYDGDENSLCNLSYMLGASYFFSGDYESAYQNLKSAMDSGFENEDCAMMYAVAALKTDRRTEAGQAMTAASFGDGGTEFVEAVEAEEDGDYATAAEKYELAAEKIGDDMVSAECIVSAVKLYFNNGDYAKAVELCAEAQTLAPGMDETELASYKAMALHHVAMESGDTADYETAAAAYKQLEELGKADEASRINCAECLLSAGKEDESLAELTALADEGSEHASVYIGIVRILYERESAKKASARDYSEVLKYCELAEKYVTDEDSADYIAKVKSEAEAA